MADQLNLRGNGPAPVYFQPFKNNIFRLDEGYSEETRSQTGSEMRADSRMGDVDVDADGPSALLLPEWTVNLSESERSGML
jgi:F-box and WD-40 domain protein 1/11